MRGRWVLVAAVATALVFGCGVRAQDSPERVPPPEQPSFGVESTGDVESVDAVVYLVERGRLVPDRVPASTADPEDALRALLAVAGPRGARRTAVPAGSTLRSLSRDGDLVTVDLDSRFAEVRGRDQPLAAAQVVFTVTEQPPARRVRITVNGQPLPIPSDAGATGDEPLTRESFESLTPR